MVGNAADDVAGVKVYPPNGNYAYTLILDGKPVLSRDAGSCTCTRSLHGLLRGRISFGPGDIGRRWCAPGELFTSLVSSDWLAPVDGWEIVSAELCMAILAEEEICGFERPLGAGVETKPLQDGEEPRVRTKPVSQNKVNEFVLVHGRQPSALELRALMGKL